MTSFRQADLESVPDLVNRLAFQLGPSGMLTAGDASELRRASPRRPPAGFFKLEGLLLDDVLPGDASPRAEAETRWAAIVAGLAQLGSLHRPGRRLGDALFDADFSELRFSRLMRSDAERLIDDLPMLARFLAAKGVPVDWAGAAHLLLSSGSGIEESVRRHVARDYYRSALRGSNSDRGENE